MSCDGSPLEQCLGCGFPLSSAKKNQPCPRCGEPCCRICREDKPHQKRDGTRCELPPGQLEKTWGYKEGEEILRTFD